MTPQEEQLVKMRQLDQEEISIQFEVALCNELIASLRNILPVKTPMRFYWHLDDISNHLRTLE